MWWHASLSSRLVSSRLVLSCLFWTCLVLCCRILCLSCLLWSLCRLVGRVVSFLIVLGVFWDHFWSSWESFWASWAVLRGPGTVLKAVDGPKPGKRFSRAPLRSIFGPILGLKTDPRRPQDGTLRPQDDPRGRQDGAQEDQNSIIKST